MRQLGRDYFFEFAGMPQSGKTTIMETMADLLESSNFLIKKYRGGSKNSPLYPAPIADLNLLLASNAVRFTITALGSETAEHRIYLLDKGLIDRCIFTDTLVRHGKVRSEDAEKIKAFLTLPRLLERLDGVFVFVTSPEIALKREYGEKPPDPGREVMNADFLASMYSTILDDYQEQLHYRVKNARIIRTDKGDEQKTINFVLNDIMGIINSNIEMPFHR